MCGCRGGSPDSDGRGHAVHDHAGHAHTDHDHSANPHSGGHDGHDHSSTDSRGKHSGCDGHDHKSDVKPASGANTHSTGVHDHSKETEGAEPIFFSTVQAALAGLEVETVGRSAFRSVIRCSGEIISSQGDRVTISAPVSGVVSFAGTILAEGSAVAPGRALLYISSKGMAGGDQFESVRAGYERARSEKERLETLRADNIVSAREYEAALTDYLQAKAQYEALSAMQSPRGSAVGSPIGGYVSQLLATEGDYVGMGQPLLAVSRGKKLMLKADVPQRYYGALHGSPGARFTASGSGRLFNLEAMGGRLVAIGTPSAATAYMIPVTFEFDAAPGVLPGSLVEVLLLGTPREGVASIPLSAITEAQGVYYVYLQLCGEEYVRREVRCGMNDGERVEILSGLKPGDRVVIRGAVQVGMAASAGAIPHGHTH